MSGGLYDYRDSMLQSEMFGWLDEGEPIPNVLEDREISELTYELLNLIHIFDLYRSGDTGKDSYLKEKDKFKKKWLSNRGVRVKRIIDAGIDELRKELYETYGCLIEESDDNG